MDELVIYDTNIHEVCCAARYQGSGGQCVTDLIIRQFVLSDILFLAVLYSGPST